MTGLDIAGSAWLHTALAVALLMIAGTVSGALLDIRPFRGPVIAILRAAIQLTVLGLILQGIVTDLRWVFFWLIVMTCVAIWTSGRRIGVRTGQQWSTVGFGIVSGAGFAIAVVLLTGALTPTPQHLLAIGGILIGNAMTISSIFGRSLLRAVHENWHEIEGWIALGADTGQATLRLRREAAATSLLPTVDQTRTTGLVTLPGAFVGSLFGGASPIGAGQFQLIVLAGVLCAGAICMLVLAHGLTQGGVRSLARIAVPETKQRSRSLLRRG